MRKRYFDLVIKHDYLVLHKTEILDFVGFMIKNWNDIIKLRVPRLNEQRIPNEPYFDFNNSNEVDEFLKYVMPKACIPGHLYRFGLDKSHYAPDIIELRPYNGITVPHKRQRFTHGIDFSDLKTIKNDPNYMIHGGSLSLYYSIKCPPIINGFASSGFY